MSAIKINGTWQRVSAIKIKKGGVWADHTALYARLEGAWHLIDLGAEAKGPAYHVWKAYADDAFGVGISLDPTDKKYLGFATGQTVAEPNLSDPTIFDWSLIKGKDGVDGTDVDESVLNDILDKQDKFPTLVTDAEGRIDTAVEAQKKAIGVLDTHLKATDVAFKAADAKLTTGLAGAKTSIDSTIVELGGVKDGVTGLTALTSGHESKIVDLEKSSTTQAQKVKILETSDGNSKSRIASLETTTGKTATQLNSLGVWDGLNFSTITEVKEASSSHAKSIAELETSDGATTSRVKKLEETDATHATRLTGVETSAADSKSKVSTLETTTAAQAKRISTVETKGTATESKVSALEATTEETALRVTGVETNATLLDGKVSTAQKAADAADAKAVAAGKSVTTVSNRVGTLEKTSVDNASRLTNVETKSTTAVTNAATAQAKADLGIKNAAAAQTKADLGVKNAAAAKVQADKGVSGSAVAQAKADKGVADAKAAKAAADAAQGTADEATATLTTVTNRVGTLEATSLDSAKRITTVETTSNTAVTNAATAQAKADKGVLDAAAAQAKADLGVKNAATAQTKANAGVTNAAAAKVAGDKGIADAAAAKLIADKGVADAKAAKAAADAAALSATTVANRVSTIEETGLESAKRLTTVETTSTSAVSAAAAAQAVADKGVLDAAAAQAKADMGVSNAAAAQTQANKGVTNAATAQTQANKGVTNAATAQAKADLGVKNAATAQAAATAAKAVADAATAKITTVTNRVGTLEETGLESAKRLTTVETTSTTAVADAAAAQAKADKGVLDAAAAQAKADKGVLDAAAAQTKANAGVTNAAAAKVAGDKGIADAAAAKIVADKGVAAAAAAQAKANKAATDLVTVTNRVTATEKTDAAHASRLTAVETKSNTTLSKVTVLEKTTKDSATRIEAVNTQRGKDIAAATSTAKTYTDQITGAIKAERVIKADANGKVSGVHLLATGSGADAGGKLYFQADEIAIVPPSWNGKTELDKTKFPFYFSEDRNSMYLDEATIKKLSAEIIDSGRLVVDGLSLMTKDLSLPAGSITGDMLDASFKDGLVRVNPNAAALGGTVSKEVRGVAYGTSLKLPALKSGGNVHTVNVRIVAPNGNSRISGHINISLFVNGAALKFNDGSDVRKIGIKLEGKSVGGPSKYYAYVSSVNFSEQIITPARASGTDYVYEMRVVGVHVNDASYAAQYSLSFSASEPVKASGGFITDVNWDEVKSKPAQATRWPSWGEVGGKPALALANQVLTNVPAGAKFTDTNTHRAISDSVTTVDAGISASLTAVKTAYDRGTSALNVANTKLAATAKAVDSAKLEGRAASSFANASHAHAGHDVKTLSHRLNVDSDGKIRANHTDFRRAGMYGIYDAARIGHIWSMGDQYQIDAKGANFGNLYGLAYKHTNNATGGTMAGGHQVVWVANGTPRAAMGETGLWSATNITAGGEIKAAGAMKARASNGTVSRVLTHDDFLPANPPAGLENTITANWIGAGAINAKHLQVSSLVKTGGKYTSFKVAPEAERPISLSNTDAAGNEIDPIFYVDTRGNGYFKGKLSKGTVDIESIQEEARKQINPYYLGTVAGSSQRDHSKSNMPSGSSYSLPFVRTVQRKVNLAWTLGNAAKPTNPPANATEGQRPSWRVEVFRGSAAGTRIVNKTYEGDSYSSYSKGVVSRWQNIHIEDSYTDTNAAASQVYTIRVTYLGGMIKSLFRTAFTADSPSFKKMEVGYEYTTIYYNAAGLNRGDITISEDYDKFDFLLVTGTDDGNKWSASSAIPTHVITADVDASKSKEFTLFDGATCYWRAKLSGKRTFIYAADNCLIRRIWGVKLKEK